MSDQFDKHELKPEKLNWKPFGKSLYATTSVGEYTIRQKHHLYYQPHGMLHPEYLGNFKDPKAKARKHYNEEAL